MDYFDKRDNVPSCEDGNDNFSHQLPNGGSEILEFYEKKNVLVTDASEVGILLIDRLLRSCPKIGTIYLLLKPGKKKSHKERNDEYFFSEVYDKINQTHQYLKKKLKVIHGDYTQPYCGISKYDQKLLANEVRIVFHCAGSNKYDDLKNLYYNNIQSTKSLLELACKMKNLKAFIYVSSVQAELFRADIEEKFHERIFSVKNSKTWEEQLQMIAPKIVRGKGELSDFTKAVAEQVVREYNGRIPVAIVRSKETYKDNHIFNWKQFLNMSNETHSTLISALKYYQYGIIDDSMPADNFINTMVAISWKIGTDKSERIAINTPEYDVTSSWNSRIPTDCQEHLTEDSNLIYQAISKQSLKINKSDVISHKRGDDQKQHVNIVLVLLMLYLYLKIYCNIYKLLKTLVETVNLNSSEYYHSLAQSSNVDKLWSSMSNVDKKLFNFNIINNDENQCSSRNIKNMIAYLFQEDFSDLEMNNASYIRYQHVKTYLKIFLYIASTYFIVNSIYFIYLVKYCNLFFL